ncbi:MAG TPA: hypothetical protein VFN61_06275, partial [Acidimicrobiales bacterium]|nr:hypothetical protein [Acidimicrobiales bacterium]
YCVAVGYQGTWAVYSGGKWEPGKKVPGASYGLNGVSCTSDKFCVAISTESSLAYTYNGATWAPSQLMDPAGGPYSVSCGTDRFCTAVDDSGHAVTGY